MLYNSGIRIIYAITIHIVFFKNRSPPRCKIWNRSCIISTIILCTKISTVPYHIILRKIVFFLWHKTCLNCRKRCKCPACSIYSLVFYFSQSSYIIITVSWWKYALIFLRVYKIKRIFYRIPLIRITKSFFKHMCINIISVIILLHCIFKKYFFAININKSIITVNWHHGIPLLKFYPIIRNSIECTLEWISEYIRWNHNIKIIFHINPVFCKCYLNAVYNQP